jgi:hypothetical protein
LKCPSTGAAYGHAYFDFTDNVRGFVEGSFGHVMARWTSRYFGAALPIFADNPFRSVGCPRALPCCIRHPVRNPSNPREHQPGCAGHARGHSA